MNQTARLQRLLERRWLRLSLALVIGPVSGFLLWATLRIIYYDYWLSPKLKAADPGLYIYPQLRYTVFYAVLLLWCLDGLVAAGLSLRSVSSSRSIARWAYRTIVLYFVLLVALLAGGSLMIYVRSRGF
jgi:hypothetical protein